MAKHSGKQSTIKTKDSTKKQWESLDTINQLICYYYYIYFKSSSKSKEKIGWNIEKSGSAEHFKWNTKIKEHFTSASSFLSRAKVKLAIVTQWDTLKRTCVPLFIVLYLIRRHNLPCFFQKKLCESNHDSVWTQGTPVEYFLHPNISNIRRGSDTLGLPSMAMPVFLFDGVFELQHHLQNRSIVRNYVVSSV